ILCRTMWNTVKFVSQDSNALTAFVDGRARGITTALATPSLPPTRAKMNTARSVSRTASHVAQKTETSSVATTLRVLRATPFHRVGMGAHAAEQKASLVTVLTNAALGRAVMRMWVSVSRASSLETRTIHRIRWAAAE